MSIRLKLTLIFLAFALIPIILVGTLTFNNYRNTLEAEHLSYLENVAAFKADKIGTYFDVLKRDMEIVQNSYLIKKNLPHLIQFAQDPRNPEFITAKEILDKGILPKATALLDLTDIMLLNPEGRVVYSSNPKHAQREFLNPLPGPGQKAFREGKEKISISDVFLSQELGDKPAMLVTAPVSDLNGAYIGVIAFEVDMSSVYKIIQEVTGLGRTGETLVGKKIGNEVLFLNPLRHDSQAAFKRRVRLGDVVSIPIQKAAQGESGSDKLIDYRGKRVIAAWQYLPSPDWGVVAKIDTDEALAEVINLRNLVLFILTIISVLAVVMALFVSQTIAKPIVFLSKGAEIIGSGNLDYRIETNLKDEIGRLAGSFNAMARDLKVASASRDAERQRLYSVLEALPVYVVLLDKDYRVPFANKFFRERFGESHGKRCYEYLFKRNEACENCETYKVMKTNAPHHWEWTGPDNRNYDIYDFPFTDTDGSLMILEMGIDITEVKRAESALKKHQEHLEELVKERTAALRESEEKFHKAFADSAIGFAMTTPDGRFVDANSAYCALTGYGIEELRTLEFSQLIHPDDSAENMRLVDKMLAGQIAYFVVENRYFRKGGIAIWVKKSVSLVRNAEGAPKWIIALVEDVTERKKAEEELWESQKDLSHAQEVAHIGNWRLDVHRNILAWSEEVHRMFGIPKGTVVTYETFVSCIHPDDREFVDKSWKAALKGKPYDIEHRILAGNEVKWVREQAELEFGKQGELLGGFGIVQDITRRKRLEDALRKSHSELEKRVQERTMRIRINNALLKVMTRSLSRKEFIDSSVKLIRGLSGCRCVGIRLLDEKKRIPYESYIGFSQEFWKQENWLSLDRDDCACIRVIQDRAIALDKPVLTEGGSFVLEDSFKFIANLKDKEKERFRGVCMKVGFQSVAVIPIRYRDKVIGGIHLADERQGQLKKIEFIESLTPLIGEGIHKFSLTDNLRQSSELLERVFASTNVLIALMDNNFNFIRVNQAYAEAENMTPESFIGKNHFEVYPHKENEIIFKQVAASGEPYITFAKPFEYFGHPERGVTYWDWSLQSIKDSSGNSEGLILFLVNVSKRKLAEAELMRAQRELEHTRRLSDIGTLAATVAHELRNPLAAIRMATFNIRRKAQNPLLDKHLNNIETKVSESDQIINNLLFYSRLRQPHYERINLSPILDECIENAQKHYSESKASVKKNYKILSDTHIDADPVQMRELCGNILNNAFDAMEGKKGKIEVSAELEANQGVKLYFKDSGVGMDEEHLKQAHEPFFTTKAKGTGLGLAVCFQIARLHNGEINIESQKGFGTTINVCLPVNKESSGLPNE